MYISVLGSWSDRKKAHWQFRNREEFVAACKSLGRAIHRTRSLLVVDEDSSESTATWHAFEGLCESIQANKAVSVSPSVVLVDHFKTGSRYQKRLAKYRNAIVPMESSLKGRVKRRVFQLMVSDSVVFLGGASSTYDLGKSAWTARRINVVLVGSFGGAAEKLLGERLANASEFEQTRLLPFSNRSWNEQLMNELLEQLGLKDKRKFLIIHGRGRDEHQLKVMLQNRNKLPEPIIMKDIPEAGLITMPEKFEPVSREVHAAIAIVTPDDVGALIQAEQPPEFAYRARQNVWLEIGWFWGRLGRNRLLILSKGNIELPSDLDGIVRVVYQHDISECQRAIDQFVESVTGDKYDETQVIPMPVTTRSA